MSTTEPDSDTTSRKRRGIYLLPNLFTTASLFSGFYAIVAAMQHRYEAAAIAIFIAMIWDTLDGRIARMTNTQSAFGAEYDSLSDLISFGVAPSLLIFQWSIVSLDKIGWLGAFIYTVTAALRLARFNTQVGTADKAYFQGLPSPAAAAMLAGSIWVMDSHGINGADYNILMLFLGISIGLLMVSNVRYYSFKDLDLKNKVPFMWILLMVMIFVLISISPEHVLLAIFGGYAISGPIMTLLHWRKLRHKTK
jgi:CDP-diacylglycerol--serine O-phosphatidyltransferase